MGSFDGAETCELVGVYLLYTTLETQVSHDHRSYERNLSNCVEKPEKVFRNCVEKPEKLFQLFKLRS